VIGDESLDTRQGAPPLSPIVWSLRQFGRIACRLGPVEDPELSIAKPLLADVDARCRGAYVHLYPAMRGSSKIVASGVFREHNLREPTPTQISQWRFNSYSPRTPAGRQLRSTTNPA